MTCAFVACADVAMCPLAGGCLHRPRRPVPLAPAPTLVYNPMTGGRRDLEVREEDGVTAEARWREARIAYLTALLAGEMSEAARAGYQRELARLI